MTLPKVLLVGAAGAYVVHRVRQGTARRARRATGTVPPPDPRDPVQSLYSETDTSDTSDASDEVEIPADPTTFESMDASLHDVGDLYGLHTPRAADTMHLDDDAAMENGQNWLESLATDSVEGGTEPELELDMSDDADNDRPPHSSDTHDRPIADRGSGGPAGT